ncbi:MAG: amino acid ABC transporter substrate-binding protein [Erysipelotrichaceae bacterium]
MKKFKRISLLCMCLLLVLTIGGCKEKTVVDSWDEIKKEGEIVIGIDDTFVPMGFKDKNGDIVGFDIDIATEFAKRNDLKVKFQKIDWDMKETELENNNVDLLWNGYSITESRKKKVNFSDSYLSNRQIIVVDSKAGIKDKTGLAKKNIAVQKNSSAFEAVSADTAFMKTIANEKLLEFDTNLDAFEDLDAGRTDAIVVDEVLANYMIKQRGSDKYSVLEDNFGSEEYAVGVRKTDVKLLNALNKTLGEMKKEAIWTEYTNKWFK